MIANNRLGGIRVKDADTDRNTITGNSIYANRSLGLDLDPVAVTNPNDAGDIDTGPDEQLNFPVIGRATPQKVAGNTCSGCTVEVFLADGGNGAYGQGKTFLGSATADSGGAFAATVSGVAEGNYVTTTATDAAGNTSEFSLNQVVTTAPDTAPPETTVDSGPQGTANSNSARFAFSSSEAGSTFECSLEGVAFGSCTSPKVYTNLADGSHTFEVKATDPEGNADATPASRTWTVDATAPTVQAPTQSFATGSTLDASTIPVKLTWSATDSGTGISEYKLQQSTNGGTFTTVPISITSTSNTRQLSPGNTYQFRVQAKDKAGNWSDWVTGSAFTLSDHQETSSSIAYGGTWTPQPLSSAYGGGVSYAAAKGDKAQFSFTGSSITWVATKSADGGRAEVWIDGAKVSGVDLYSSTEQPRKAVLTKNDLDSSQPHTLEVRVLGTKNTASSGTRADVDAFVVLN